MVAMGSPSMTNRWLRVAAALLLAALLACPASLLAPRRAIAQSFPDLAGQPAEIVQAIDYATNKGFMNGGPDGNFHPADPVTKMDYACTLVRLFGNASEAADPALTFTDIAATDRDYAFANIAVRHGYVGRYPDGSFRRGETVNAAAALAGLVQGLGLSERAADAAGVWPGSPPYAGTAIIAHDLHLKFANTQVWPSRAYPRGEMAFSAAACDKLEDWRKDAMSGEFSWLKCQSPLVGPARKRALDLAFVKIGFPYVWGGESDAEGGYDCSGLVYYVLDSSMGYPMMRTADDQAKDPRYATLSREALLPGDPIFFYKDPAASDYVGHAGMYVGNGLFIHSTGSNAGVSVNSIASGYYSEHFACGKRVIAEGDPDSFDTYILLANPAATPASAVLTYMLPDGRRVPVNVKLDPWSRKTVRMDDTLLNEEASTTVEATGGQVVAERSMYFNYMGKYPGGHTSAGALAPANTWFLAEGCTAYNFDTYVLVQNPGGTAASVKMTFLGTGGKTQQIEFSVPPYARHTVAVGTVKGMEQAEFSTRVDASAPVVVERSMYFDYHGIREGTNAGGVTALSPTWYFAEGYTAGAFDTYILLANPGDAPAHVRLSLQSDDGLKSDQYLTLPAHSRQTVAVDNIKGWEQKAFSARVSSDSPLAAERAMYFTYNGISGGHVAGGVTSASENWFLAEGYTAADFDTYVLISNPNREAADVSVSFLLPGGRHLDKIYKIAAQTRYTIPVDKIKGLEATEVSTAISSDLPVTAERSMYFRYLGRAGGSCEHGVTGPAARWYFAEGYTGR
jgi:hypothetical protein